MRAAARVTAPRGNLLRPHAAGVKPELTATIVEPEAPTQFLRVLRVNLARGRSSVRVTSQDGPDRPAVLRNPVAA
jgi:hypothetical protein